jgi:hypothetical protein
VNLVRGATQFGREMAHTAIFNRILSCLL